MLGFAPIGGAPLGAPLSVGADFSLSVTVVEGLRVSSALLGAAKMQVAVSGGTIQVTAAASGGFGFPIAVSDGLGLHDVGDVHRGFYRELVDAAGVHDAAAGTRMLVLTLADATRFSEVLTGIRAINATLSDTLGASSTLTVFYGILLFERLNLPDTLLANQFAHVSLVDALRLADTIRQALPVALADTVGMGLTQLTQRAIDVLEVLHVSSMLKGEGRFRVTVAQALRLRDSLAQFFGAEIDDTVGLSATLTGNLKGYATLLETVAISSTLTPKLLLAVTLDEEVALHHTDVVKMLFHPELYDAVQINVGYVAPDGSFTTWAMNTRTGAVTEYENYAFNSFARMGNRYLGASDQGLFELRGDDDEGEDIIARIRSGFLQFGGTHLSRLSAAYIATRGEGTMLLKIVEGDGREYVYSCDTRNMRSTKVHMGKGQKARYFVFELISTGQDFDLDTIEFVPVVVPRRV